MMYVFMFLVMVALDYVWARYTQHIAAFPPRPYRAACYAVGIMLLGAITVLGYTEDHWMLIPVGLGSFVGTFIAVKYGK